jgi:hypothetical protein
MSNGMDRRTEEPQSVDSTRADTEWKADSGLGNLVHGADGQVSSSHFSTLFDELFVNTRRLDVMIAGRLVSEFASWYQTR